MTLAIILFFCGVGNVLSAALAGLVGFLPEAKLRGFIHHAVSYAIGTLLGAAFLGMLPKAIAGLGAPTALGACLAGILAFHLLERALLWRHCHAVNCDHHPTAGPMILIGDGFHNFVDGLVIAGGFLASFPAGLALSLAILAHEIPQEIGDYSILLADGYSRQKALGLNVLSGFSALAGGALGYFWLQEGLTAVPYVLSFSAASFLYIALADLIPRHRERPQAPILGVDFALTLLGIGTILLLIRGAS